MYSLDASNFTTVTTKIKAAGTSALLLTYNFLHAKDYAKFTYYKIKQVDLDGKTDYSETKLVKRTFEKPFMVSLRPITNSTELYELNVSNIDKSIVTVKIVDLTGKVVYQVKVSPKTDILKQELNLITLNKGIYFVEVQNAQGKEVIKMMK